MFQSTTSNYKSQKNSQKKTAKGNEELLPVDFTVLLGTYIEDGLLAKFISENYQLALDSFIENNDSPAKGAETLVAETTTSGNITKSIPSKNKTNGGRPAPNQVIEVIPPVMEAIVSSSYVRTLSAAKSLIGIETTNTNNKDSNDEVSIHNILETVSRSAQFIRGALKGHKAKLDSINEKNKMIFDAIWSSIPFAGIMENADVLLNAATSIAGSEISNAMKLGQNSLTDPDNIGDNFQNTLEDAYDKIANNNTCAGLISASKLNELINAFKREF